MTDKELIRSLKRLAVVEDPAYRCIGCGHEHNCSIHGCRILKEAAKRLEEMCPDRTPEVERTADQMFRELGYTKREDWLKGPRDFCYEHRGRAWGKPVIRRIIIDGDLDCYECREGKKAIPMTAKEILACAQAVKEMCPDRTPE